MKMGEYLSRYQRRSHSQEYKSPYGSSSYREQLLSDVGHGKRILDVACREGLIAREMMDQHNEVWGVEINSEAARLAKQKGIPVKVANIEDGLPFEDSSFNFIHAGEVIEHLFDTRFFFRECYRVLKEDGVMVFSAPNLNSLENRIQILKGGFVSHLGSFPEDHFGRHVRIFNLSKIKELCALSGLEIERVRGFFFSDEGEEASPGGLSNSRTLANGVRRVSDWAATRMIPGLSKYLIFKVRKIRSDA